MEAETSTKLKLTETIVFGALKDRSAANTNEMPLVERGEEQRVIFPRERVYRAL